MGRQQEGSFVKGAAVLGLVGLLVRVIGMLYRVPLTNLIGTQGIAVYQVAYPIYAYLLVLATAGLPTAISRMVAQHMARGDLASARAVFSHALKLLFWIGLLASAALYFGSGALATLAGDAQAQPAIAVIAPAMLFVAVLSAFRGYFQGLQRMTPTALSQIVEQIGKLLVGLALAGQWAERGPAYGAAGALVGVTVSEALALGMLALWYWRCKRRDAVGHSVPARQTQPFGPVASQLARIAVPVTVGASIMPLVGLIDTMQVNHQLVSLGYSMQQARVMFGVLTGVVNTLANMPTVLSMALAMALVPSIAQACAVRNQSAISARAGMGFKLAWLIGLPCAVGLMLIAEPLIAALYGGIEPWEMSLGAQLLRTLSPGVLFLVVVQIMTGVLQGSGRAMLPVCALLAGALTKIVLGITLMGMPDVNIMGAALGTVACYAIAALADVVMAWRTTRMRIHLGRSVLCPLIAAVGMGAVVWNLIRVTRTMPPIMQLAVALPMGIAVYAGLLLLTGGLIEEDLTFLPGGSRMIRGLKRLRLLK